MPLRKEHTVDNQSGKRTPCAERGAINERTSRVPPNAPVNRDTIP